MTQEKAIENYLVKRVKERGGLCEKFTSPGRRSVPDRIVILPGGKLFFVELKAPGRKPTVAQAHDHAVRANLGFPVLVLNSKEAVDTFIRGTET